MSTPLRILGADASSSNIASVLREDGAVIARDVVSQHGVKAMTEQLSRMMAAEEIGGGEFMGNRTRHFGNLYSRGPIFSEQILLNRRILQVLDGTLLPQCPMGGSTEGNDAGTAQEGYNSATFDYGSAFNQPKRDPVKGPNCHHYRLHCAGIIEVWPGGKLQPLHREMDIYRPFIEHDPGQPDWVVACLVAGTEFTAANGGTRIVVGSHKWPAERVPQESEATQAEMPAGSALFWLGRTFHGLGINRTERPRTAILTIFSVNWLTQEENQYLSVPPDIARTLPEKAQQLIGYRGSMVGWSTGRDNECQLRESSHA